MSCPGLMGLAVIYVCSSSVGFCHAQNKKKHNEKRTLGRYKVEFHFFETSWPVMGEKKARSDTLRWDSVAAAFGKAINPAPGPLKHHQKPLEWRKAPAGPGVAKRKSVESWIVRNWRAGRGEARGEDGSGFDKFTGDFLTNQYVRGGKWPANWNEHWRDDGATLPGRRGQPVQTDSPNGFP